MPKAHRPDNPLHGDPGPNPEDAAPEPLAGLRSLSVVVPVRNRSRLIGPCLQSIDQTAATATAAGVQIDIVIVDDASTDTTRDVIHETAASLSIPLHLVALPSRQGPAGARNAALEQAQGELIVFVDSDEILEEGFFEAHLQAHRTAGAPAFGVGRVVSVPSLQAALARPRPTVWDASGARLDTANASVRRTDLQAVGYFDAAFEGMGWMDIDLGRRLQNHGLRRIPVTQAVTYHIQPPIQDTAQLRARLEKERERGHSAVHFMAKHPGLSARLAAQDTVANRWINWVFRVGGLVREDNVLAWVTWARRRRLEGLARMWLAGVINQAHLTSLHGVKRGKRERSD